MNLKSWLTAGKPPKKKKEIAGFPLAEVQGGYFVFCALCKALITVGSANLVERDCGELLFFLTIKLLKNSLCNTSKQLAGERSEC